MVYFVERAMSGGTHHEHISRLWWKDDSPGATKPSGNMPIETAVDWLSEPGNKAYVRNGSGWVEVAIVRPPGRDPYLRTHADGKWTDNLLALPVHRI
jgi:hypothetical protein